MLTVIDQVANQHHLLLIKALIPYLPPGNQQMLSLLVKFLELKNVQAFYQRHPAQVSACEDSREPPSITEVLTDIRNYCEGEEQSMIDQCLQIFSAMEMYTTMAQFMSDPPGQGQDAEYPRAADGGAETENPEALHQDCQGLELSGTGTGYPDCADLAQTMDGCTEDRETAENRNCKNCSGNGPGAENTQSP